MDEEEIIQRPGMPFRSRTPEVSEDEGTVLESEFGRVLVRKDDSANGPRLLIEDLKDGTEIYLDVIELVSLSQWRHDALEPLLLTGMYASDDHQNPFTVAHEDQLPKPTDSTEPGKGQG